MWRGILWQIQSKPLSILSAYGVIRIHQQKLLDESNGIWYYNDDKRAAANYIHIIRWGSFFLCRNERQKRKEQVKTGKEQMNNERIRKI